MIEGVALVISAVGLLLFVMLSLRIKEVAEQAKLKRHRSKEAGVADLLNYAALIDDGIIVCKNGALMASWMYAGDDSASSTELQQERISAVLNAALAGMGDGWMIHVDAVRREAPRYIERGLSKFPDRVSAAIDEERRRLFESRGTMYEGFFVLTVTFYPPLLAQARFVELMFDDDGAPVTKSGRYEKVIETFTKELRTIESRLSSVLNMERLVSRTFVRENGSSATYDDFLSYLQLCITGIRQPIQLPSYPVYLDALLGGQELFGGVVPKIGEQFIQIVAIEGLPLESYPGMLSLLTDLDVEYRWSTRFIFLDQQTSIAHMDKYRKKWRQKQRGIMDAIFHTNGPLDTDAVNMTLDAESAIAEVKSGVVGSGYYTSVIVLMNSDREAVEASARKLAKVIFNLGFSARVETLNTLDAFFGSLPGHGHENVRRPVVNTLNFADFLPTNTIWTGSDYAPCPLYPPNAPALMYCVTTGNSPFRLNLHVRDLGHTIMFGPTGAGKSTALGQIVAQLLRYEGMTIFAFDKGLSLYALTSACGGQHYTIAGDAEKLNFCPLQHLETQGDRAWALDWIDTVLALNGIQTTPAQRNGISDALSSMATTGGRSLSEFVASIQDIAIREALHAYTVDGPMAMLLDAEQDGLSLAGETSLTTFEIEDLMNLGEKWVLPILLYLFRRIERSLKGQPAFIFLDEAWLLLDHPVFREKIREWFKVLRKANCALFLATQNLSDAANSRIFDTILESTATKIYLPNVYARNPETAAVYLKMGLNSQQIELIASATPKRDYYLVSEKGCRMFNFAIGPLAMAFVGVSDKDTVAQIRVLEKTYGPNWVEHWLESKNLSLNDYGSL